MVICYLTPEIFERFTPTLDHPWTPPTIRLIHEEILGGTPLAPEEIAVYFDTYLFSNIDYYGLARQSDLLAIGSLCRLRNSQMVINDLAVRADMRDRGYGKRVLSELETIAKVAGATVLKVTPTHDSKATRDAESFYAYHGYRPTVTSHWAKQLV